MEVGIGVADITPPLGTKMPAVTQIASKPP